MHEEDTKLILMAITATSFFKTKNDYNQTLVTTIEQFVWLYCRANQHFSYKYKVYRISVYYYINKSFQIIRKNQYDSAKA